MNQTALDWISMSDAMAQNPVAVTLHVIANVFMFAGSLSIGGMLWYSVQKSREGTKDLKLWFQLFSTSLWLTSIIYVLNVVVLWQPLYWTLGAFKLITGILLSFVAYLLIGHVKVALNMPSRVEWEALMREKIASEERGRQLDELLSLWQVGVENKVSSLKEEKDKLAAQLQTAGVRQLSDAEKQRLERRKKVLETLEVVKNDLRELATDVEKKKESLEPEK